MPDTDWKSLEPYGISPMPRTLRGLDRLFPDIVYLLYDAENDRYILMEAHYSASGSTESIETSFEGLPCFAHFDTAQKTAFRLSTDWGSGFRPLPVPFETARMIAKLKTYDIAALVWIDAPGRPQVHFIR